jgi:hypothetical protein
MSENAGRGNFSGWLRWLIEWSPVWVLFVLGFWLVILRPLGPGLSLIPGDLGDARFNNYVLEHFYLWLSRLVPDYWNATFFYPFPGTMAFGDTLLGSAPLYALFRWMGLDMPSSFQAWYITGAGLNFVAAAYVLGRLKLRPLAVGMGAYFFAFGLPLLAQENHAQLIYHFCIPLACFALWRCYRQPRLWMLATLAGLVVWQFYLSIYMGVFLVFLLLVMFVLLPFFIHLQSFRQRLSLWPRQLMYAWRVAYWPQRILSVLAIVGFGLGLTAILLPYYHISKVYGFARSIIEVISMLPRFKSYLLADNSMLWHSLSSLITNIPMRWEHQLFPGLAVILLIAVGIGVRFRTPNRRLAWLHLVSALGLVILTLVINGISLYYLIWWVPGIKSLRSITRIILVIMWPLAIYSAWVVDGLLRRISSQRRYLIVPVYLVCGLLVAESVFYTHATYPKAEARARIVSLQQQIPSEIPADPILFAKRQQNEAWYAKEIDAMLLAQKLGWPTLNGYSGNTPPDYANADSCKQLPLRIMNYMKFAGITDENYYLEMINRVVAIGFTDCDPTWWEKMPSLSLGQ